MYAGNLNANESSFSATESKIALFNKDDSPEASALTNYLKDTMDYVPFKGNQEAIDDALYFQELNYVVEIPKGFGASLQSGSSPMKLAVQVKAGSLIRYMSTISSITISRLINFIPLLFHKKQQMKSVN